MIISVVFKSGFELWIKCEKIDISVNKLTGQLTKYAIAGIEDNKPIYIDVNEIACIYRVLQNEEGGQND